MYLDEGCNIDESEDGDEDEDVHVCGSCKSAFGNVGKEKILPCIQPEVYWILKWKNKEMSIF